MDRHNRKYNTNTGLENFILRLAEHNKDISYYSGYTNSESKVKLKCNICGTIIERYASCVRQNKKIRCFNCEKLKTKRDKTLKQLKTKGEKALSKIQLTFSICDNCGNLFLGNTKYCSKRCRERKHEHIKTRKRINNAKVNGRIDNDITLDKLIKRDNNICYLCSKQCDSEDYYINNNGIHIAGNNYPSIDHIIPLNKGGTHTWSNIKLAHRLCNSIKKDKRLVVLKA